jgi:hypothetical protein
MLVLSRHGTRGKKVLFSLLSSLCVMTRGYGFFCSNWSHSLNYPGIWFTFISLLWQHHHPSVVENWRNRQLIPCFQSARPARHLKCIKYWDAQDGHRSPESSSAWWMWRAWPILLVGPACFCDATLYSHTIHPLHCVGVQRSTVPPPQPTLP